MFWLLIAALFLSGCAGQSDYYKAVLAIESAREESDKAKWQAVAAGMAKASPEGAAMAAMAIAMSKGGESVRAQIAAPRDGWDYFIQGLSAIGTLTQAVGGVIVPVRLAQESRKTNEAMYASNVAIEQVRGTTQATINGQTVAGLRDLGISAANAPRGSITNNTIGGNGVIGNGVYTGPVTTTTTNTNSFNPIMNSYNPITTNPTPRVCTTNATGVLNCQGG